VTARLSDDLQALLARADGRELTIGQIIDTLHGRGFNVFVAFLVLPFCQPIPLPGISTPFGLVLLLYGFRVAIGREPWLPRRLLDVRISYPVLSKLVAAGSVLARWIERLIKPRLRAFTAAPPVRIVNGLAIMASAFVFMLPLPIPLSNAIPAWAVLLGKHSKRPRRRSHSSSRAMRATDRLKRRCSSNCDRCGPPIIRS